MKTWKMTIANSTILKLKRSMMRKLRKIRLLLTKNQVVSQPFKHSPSQHPNTFLIDLLGGYPVNDVLPRNKRQLLPNDIWKQDLTQVLRYIGGRAGEGKEGITQGKKKRKNKRKKRGE